MIILYTKDDCIWCEKAKTLLKEQKFSYHELLLNKDYVKEDLQNLLGEGKKVTVPQIIINGKLIGGYEDLLEYFEQHSIFGMQQ
jgi:glutaredoxin